MEDCEEIRCEKDGYFDIDSMKPYSSIWVSTKRDVRPKTHQQDDEMEMKKNIMPSKACKNLHSLLENTDGSPSKESSKEEIHNQTQNLPSTKSDHFPLNPYKIFEKVDSVSLRKLSDRIIESMCKSEAIPLLTDAELNTIKKSVVWPKEKQVPEKVQEPNCDEEQFKEEGEKDDKDNSNGITQKKSLKTENPSKETLYKDTTKLPHLGGGEPKEDEIKQNQILTENGKMLAAMNLTTLTIKDQTGKEYPLTVKYEWETDTNEILNIPSTLTSSAAFIKMVELISSLESKSAKKQVLPPTIVKTQQDRTKSQSTCNQNKNKRLDSLAEVERYTESSHCIGSKGDAFTIKKNPIKEPLKNALLRSKVSILGNVQDKKVLDSSASCRDMKADEGNREFSKTNMADKKNLGERKNRLPVKKTVPAVNELKMPNNLGRPSTFNKAPRPPLNRPPSAPTRELPSKIPQRIVVQESGDKLSTAFNKRSFAGGKFQAPVPAANSNKGWK